MEKIKCEFCGNKFKKNRKHQKYCSVKCRGKIWTQKRRLSGACKSCGNPTEINIETNLHYVLCNKCSNRRSLQHKKYLKNNYKAFLQEKETKKRNIIKHKDRVKDKLLQIYGNCCSCCGETIKEFLTLEHKNGNGGKHRSKLGGSLQVYKSAIKNINFDEYTILCISCNWATRFGKICPHKIAQAIEYEDIREG